MSQTKDSEGDMVYNEADALKAFSQVHVMQKASKLITFNTYQGRYSYKQMLFGIISQDVFQMKVMVSRIVHHKNGILVLSKFFENQMKIFFKIYLFKYLSRFFHESEIIVFSTF